MTVTSNPRKTKKKLQYHDASRSKTKFRNRSFVALILWLNKTSGFESFCLVTQKHFQQQSSFQDFWFFPTGPPYFGHWLHTGRGAPDQELEVSECR